MTSSDQRGVRRREIAARYKKLTDQATACFNEGVSAEARAQYYRIEAEANVVFSALAAECGNDAPTIRRALADVGYTI